MSARSELHQVVDDLLDEDPRTALIAYRRLVEDELPWLEQRVVALARREEWTWGRIARLLGRKRQSVHERFRELRPAIRTSPEGRDRRDNDRFAALLNWPQHRPPDGEEEVVGW